MHSGGISHCEVPLSEVSSLDLPVVYGADYRNFDHLVVNILGDIYTSVWWKHNKMHKGITHSAENKKIYNFCTSELRYNVVNKNRIIFGVPHVCGCSKTGNGVASREMYAVIGVNYEEINVIRFDTLPVKIISIRANNARGLNQCPAGWMADMLGVVCMEVIKKYGPKNFKVSFKEHCGSGVLFRMCNARFLKEVALEDFKRELERYKQKTIGGAHQLEEVNNEIT
jgi:hypothetical protein